jgi:hypothetical protein
MGNPNPRLVFFGIYFFTVFIKKFKKNFFSVFVKNEPMVMWLFEIV